MRLQRLECEAFNKNELTSWPQDSTPDCVGCALNQSTWPVKAKLLLGLLWVPAEGDFSPEKCRLFYLIHLEWVLLLIHLLKFFFLRCIAQEGALLPTLHGASVWQIAALSGIISKILFSSKGKIFLLI